MIGHDEIRRKFANQRQHHGQPDQCQPETDRAEYAGDVRPAVLHHPVNHHGDQRRHWQGEYPTKQAQPQAKQEQAVSLLRETAPRFRNLGLVKRDTMQEHEFAPAAEPEKEQPKPQTNDHQKGRQGNDPFKIAEDEVFGLFEIVAEIFTTVSAAARAVKTRASSAFPQISQPRAETDDKPFAEVKRVEKHQLHPLQRRADGFDHVDFLGPRCDGLNGVH
jgi:hypothetical protein